MNGIKNLLLFFFLAINILTAKSFDKLDAYSKGLLARILQLKNEQDLILFSKNYGYPFHNIGGKVWVDLLIETEDQNFDFVDLNGIKLLASGGNVFAIRTPIDKLNDFISEDKIHRVQFGRKYLIQLDSVRKSVRANDVHSGLYLPKSYTGKGVIIGVFDTGIDYQHPDFNDSTETRILYLWDMSESGSDKPPQGYDWGREYTKDEIDNEPEKVLQRDFVGHGTHVAGIAAGGGKSNAEYRGIASEANLIVVKGSREPFSDKFTDGDIIAGCSYIFRKAEELGKPCVVNLSLGLLLGSHDGEDLLSKALNNLVSSTPGRAIVASAGNSGNLQIHSGGNVSLGQRFELLLNPVNVCDIEPSLCPDIPNYYMFGADIWTDPNLIDSVYVGIYSNEQVIISEKGFSSNDVKENVQIFDQENNLVGIVSISNSKTEISDNILIVISNQGIENLPIDNFLWSIVLVPKASGRFDSWSVFPLGSQLPINSRYSRFPSDNAMTVGSPAVGEKIISVGSYNTKNQYVDILGRHHNLSDDIQIESLSSFSSRGPSRDGRILPIITAPGAIVVSTFSNSTDFKRFDSTELVANGMYIVKSGTSMSAPCVTGALALLFEQSPNLSIDEIIDLLKISARKDEFTTFEPNNDYGWGKLDILRLLQVVTDVQEQLAASELGIYPNPAFDKVYFAAKDDIIDIQIFDTFGKLCTIAENRIANLTELNSGIYFARVRTQYKIYTCPFIKY